MSELRFKVSPNFELNKIYSVCLRGVRQFDELIDLYDCSDGVGYYLGKAKLDAAQVFKFDDLRNFDVEDNYDSSVRTVDALQLRMLEMYKNFSRREIVTILTFKIISI